MSEPVAVVGTFLGVFGFTVGGNGAWLFADPGGPAVGPLTTAGHAGNLPGDGARFALYEAGRKYVQIQAQHLNTWVLAAQPAGGPVLLGASPDLIEARMDPARNCYRFDANAVLGVTLDDKMSPSWWTDPPQDQLDLFTWGPYDVCGGVFDMRNTRSGANADLTNVILDRAVLNGVNLTNVNFTNASLDDVIFNGATLTGANLANHDLRVVMLSASTNLSGANLQGVTLTGTVVAAGTNLSGADLRGAKLGGATLAGVDLSGADLRGAIVDGLVLSGSNLAGTNFSGLDLTKVTFGANPKYSTDPNHLTNFSAATVPYAALDLAWSYLNLNGAKVVGMPVDAKGRLSLAGLQAMHADLTGWTLTNANLKRAVFTSATLMGAGLSNTDCTRANFNNANLVGATLSGADCTRANFNAATLGGGPEQGAAVMSRATLFDATFVDAQLSGVNFSGAYLYGGEASVSGATLAGVDFSSAYLANLDLSNIRNANLEGAIFDRACCVNCNFKGTNLARDPTGRGGSFVSACLQGADFTDATLGAADLVDAGFAPPAATPGASKFPVTLMIGGSPVSISITVNDAGTLLPATATSAGAVCPDRSHGPCSGRQLYTQHAPTAWPVVAAEAA